MDNQMNNEKQQSLEAITKKVVVRIYNRSRNLNLFTEFETCIYHKFIYNIPRL